MCQIEHADPPGPGGLRHQAEIRGDGNRSAKLLTRSPRIGLQFRARPDIPERQRIDGGGATSTGGTFALNGTIGQPEAGRMSDNRFVIEGGFWPWNGSGMNCV